MLKYGTFQHLALSMLCWRITAASGKTNNPGMTLIRMDKYRRMYDVLAAGGSLYNTVTCSYGIGHTDAAINSCWYVVDAIDNSRHPDFEIA